MIATEKQINRRLFLIRMGAYNIYKKSKYKSMLMFIRFTGREPGYIAWSHRYAIEANCR